MTVMWCDRCKAVVLVEDGESCSICGYKGDQYENIFYDPRVQALKRDSLRPSKIEEETS